MKIESTPAPGLPPAVPAGRRSRPPEAADAVARVAASNQDAAIVRPEDATRLAAATRTLLAERAREAAAAQPVNEKRLLDLLA